MKKRAKGLFITATGTDVGKTYITALLIKKMRNAGFNCGYFKAAISGADTINNSDAGYVNKFASIGQSEETLVPYLYKTAVSPHLAAILENRPVELDTIKAAFFNNLMEYSHITMEGSGGIVCPIRYDEKSTIFLKDLIKEFQLPSLIVADAGLGTINSVVLTVEYMQNNALPIKGIILNNYTGSIMQENNITMIEAITGIKILALVQKNDIDINLDSEIIEALYV